MNFPYEARQIGNYILVLTSGHPDDLPLGTCHYSLFTLEGGWAGGGTSKNGVSGARAAGTAVAKRLNKKGA